MKRIKPLLIVLLALTLVILIAGAASACPMCKDSLAKASTDGPSSGGFFSGGSVGGGGGSVGGGFNNSIYTMLIGFFGAVGVVAFNITRGIRNSGVRDRRNQDENLKSEI